VLARSRWNADIPPDLNDGRIAFDDMRETSLSGVWAAAI